MILYTLLTTHTDTDMTNVVLTSCIVYYIGYSIAGSFMSDEYNYMGIAAIALLDLYLSNGILQGTSKPSKPSKPKPKPKLKPKPKHRRKVKVRFDPAPTVHTYTPIPPRFTQPMQSMQPMQLMQPMQPMQQFGQNANSMPMIDNRAIAADLESNDSESSVESIAVSDTISWSSEDL